MAARRADHSVSSSLFEYLRQRSPARVRAEETGGWERDSLSGNASGHLKITSVQPSKQFWPFMGHLALLHSFDDYDGYLI